MRRREAAHPAQRRRSAFPTVTSVRVKDALDAVNDVVGQLAMAIRGASAIALIASVLVLAGALAAGHRAAALRCGGAEDAGRDARRGLLSAFALEYGTARARHGACSALLAGRPARPGSSSPAS